MQAATPKLGVGMDVIIMDGPVVLHGELVRFDDKNWMSGVGSTADERWKVKADQISPTASIQDAHHFLQNGTVRYSHI